jgi:hypothetical protein
MREHDGATRQPDLPGRPAATLHMPLPAFVGRWHGQQTVLFE